MEPLSQFTRRWAVPAAPVSEKAKPQSKAIQARVKTHRPLAEQLQPEPLSAFSPITPKAQLLAAPAAPLPEPVRYCLREAKISSWNQARRSKSCSTAPSNRKGKSATAYSIRNSGSQ